MRDPTFIKYAFSWHIKMQINGRDKRIFSHITAQQRVQNSDAGDLVARVNEKTFGGFFQCHQGAARTQSLS